MNTERLVDKLGNGDRSDRVSAIRGLAKTSGPAIVKLVIAQLQDAEYDVREAAAKALGRIGHHDAVQSLIKSLDDPSDHVRKAAVRALGRIGDPRAIEALTMRSSDSDSIRKAAINALGHIGNPRAVPPLIAYLGDANGVIRGAAALALWRVGDRSAVEPLTGLLSHTTASTRRAAAEALGGIGDPSAVEPLINLLFDNAPSVRSAAATSLRRFGKAETAEFVCSVMEGKPISDPPGQMVGDNRMIRWLIALLPRGDLRRRMMAAQALGRISDPSAVKAITAQLDDLEPGMREAAANALGQIGDPWALQPLVERLADRAWGVRAAAAEALGRILNPIAIQPLIDLLADDHPEVRAAAAASLERLGKGRVARFVCSAIEGKRALDSAQALIADGEMRMLDPIVQALRDIAPRTRSRSILTALESISRVIQPTAHTLFCSKCLARFEKKTIRAGLFRTLGYHTCRLCGKAGSAVFDVREVIAFLDRHVTSELTFFNGTMRINWLARRSLFDFDSVEIIDATDDDVIRFRVQVGNDADPYRTARYRSIPVTALPECKLEENTIRNLRDAFGEVRWVGEGGLT